MLDKFKSIFGILAVPMYVMIVGIVLTSCSNGFSNSEFEVTCIPVQQEEDGNWSLMDSEGKLKYENEFKKTPSCVVNGYFKVPESNGFTLYKAGTKPEAVKNCEELKEIGYMVGGLIPVVRNKSRICIVDDSGKDKFTLNPVNNKEIIQSGSHYSDGMLWVKIETDEYGFVNTKGEVKVKPVFETVYDFSEGCALVKKDDVTKLIDKEGKEVLKLKKDWELYSCTLLNGVFVVKDQNGRILFVDKKGDATKCPSKVKGINDYNEDYYIYSDGESVGVMSRKNDEVLIRPKYKNISFIGNGKFLCQDEKKSYIVNKDGEISETLEDYEWVMPWEDFGFIAKEKNSYLYLDNNGEPKKGSEYHQVSYGLDYAVSSDYFSVEGMANSVLEKLTATGYGNIKLGASPQSFLSNPKDYEYRSNVEIDSLSGKGYRYKYTVEATFTGSIAGSNWNFNYYTYEGHYTYYWNNVTVNSIAIGITAETNLGETGVKALMEGMTKKGFTTYASKFKPNAGGGAILTGKESTVVIMGEGTNIYMLIYEKATDEALKEIKSQLETSVEGFKEESTSNNTDFGGNFNPNSLTAEEEVLVDTVAVEDYDDW